MRLALFFNGRMPVTQTLTYQWYDTPNIHLCTIADFIALCEEEGIVVERSVSLDSKGLIRFDAGGRLSNWLSEQAVFLLRRP